MSAAAAPTPPESSAPPVPASASAVAAGHVRLILAIGDDGEVYMEIPLARIAANCNKPRAYLRYLGAYTTGDMTGFVSRDLSPFSDICEDGELDDGETYRFVVSGNPYPLGSASIDLAALERRSSAATSTTACIEFKALLEPRDPVCAFTGLSGDYCNAQHLFPHSRGDEWLNAALHNRPKDPGENVDDVDSVDSPRNGLIVQPTVRVLFERHAIAYLKTPNCCLKTDDVPPPAERALHANVEYPVGSRYTLQWLATPGLADLEAITQNTDAAFAIASRMPKPADVLLHYTYCGAAMAQWGRTNVLFQQNPDLPRPHPPSPSRTRVLKHSQARREQDGEAQVNNDTASNGAGYETAELWEPSETNAVIIGEYGPVGTGGRLDADQILSWFSYNTVEARARRGQEEATFSHRMHTWAEHVAHDVTIPETSAKH